MCNYTLHITRVSARNCLSVSHFFCVSTISSPPTPFKLVGWTGVLRPPYFVQKYGLLITFRTPEIRLKNGVKAGVRVAVCVWGRPRGRDESVLLSTPICPPKGKLFKLVHQAYCFNLDLKIIFSVYLIIYVHKIVNT